MYFKIMIVTAALHLREESYLTLEVKGNTYMVRNEYHKERQPFVIWMQIFTCHQIPVIYGYLIVTKRLYSFFTL